MFALLRGPKRRRLAWLYFHLLLWASLPATGGGGETCRSGASAGGAFLCPQASDGADARFCCGTCSAPYCCSSKEARLDQAQCPAAPPTGRTTAAPPPSTTPASPNSDVTTVSFISLALLAIGCCLCLCSWRQSRNQRQQNVPLLLQPLPDLLAGCDPSTFDPPPSDSADAPPPDDPPPYSDKSPHGHGTSSPTSNIPPDGHLALATAACRGDGAQPGLPHPSEATFELGSLSPSQVRAASSVPAPSDDDSRGPRTSAQAGFVGAAGYSKGSTAPSDDPPHHDEEPYDSQALAAALAPLLDPSPSQASVSRPVLSLSEYEALGARPRTSASVGRGPPRYNPTSSLDYDGRPPYSAEDPPASQALAALQGDPPIRLDANTDLSDAPPGRSARASPPVSPDDPPPYSAALGPDRRALPRALEGPPAVLLLPENPGAAEDEEMLVVPPDLLDFAPGGPILEPMAEAEEQDVPPA